jgi:enoyl-CoA hydratase/carnithine racemase
MSGHPRAIIAGMPIAEVPVEVWLAALGGSATDGPWSTPGSRDLLVVDLDRWHGDGDRLPPLHTGRPVVVAGTTGRDEPEGHPAASVCDVVVPAGDPVLDAIATTVADHPIAAAAFALLLRGAGGRSVDDGLLVESAVYSTLQAGPEFAAWRAGRPVRPRDPEGPPVELRREGDELHVVLCRPAVRNALDSAMRDALVEAFALVRADPTITRVHLEGDGPAFCAGGDLDEFGSFPDPALAHLVRLQQSVGRAIDAEAHRVTAHLHGACVGSGIELPAFAADVVADPSTVIALPEVSLGLVPGAGGTVSLPRRIGRHRTARLGLSGEHLDAGTAKAWGLVDRLVAPGG